MLTPARVTRQALDADQVLTVPIPRPLFDHFRYCLSDGVPKRSAGVALVVGTVLNLINQGDVILSGGEVDALKIVLTYCVPYAVATYGAVSFRLRTEAR